ncbi:MAG: tRNA dihydrouridine synthase DusB [Balneolaceae bacterium]|nr:tRNA dihydrouridine synthase DusB [Balneolaceae bacterium]
MKIGSIDLGKKPLFLAPMEDVTDSPFRLMCRRRGASIVYTEFISSEAIVRDSNGAMQKMDFSEEERPFGVQIFGSREVAMEGAAQTAEANNPDLIDINFGCPVYKIAKKGAGAGCLKDLALMERMAGSVVDAVKDRPVTVKTRLGWDDNTIRIQEVALMLQKLGVKALTVHARTRNQKYKGNARWEWLRKLKNTPGLEIPIIGNGDVTSPQDAKRMFDETGVDGVMIGRGAIGSPWIFEQTRHFLETGN